MKEWMDWLNSFYFFQWLAVTAFLLALIGVLNAILGLKDRFKNWNASRSKKGLEKRLRQLSSLISEISNYQNSPPDYFAFIADFVVRISLCFALAAFGTLAFFPLLYVKLITGTNLPTTLLFPIVVIIGFLVTYATHTSLRAFKVTFYYRNPEKLLFETLSLIKTGKANGHIASNEAEVIKLIRETNIFPKTQNMLIVFGVDNLKDIFEKEIESAFNKRKEIRDNS